MTVKGDSGAGEVGKMQFAFIKSNISSLIGLTHQNGSPRAPETLAPVLILNTNWLTKNTFLYRVCPVKITGGVMALVVAVRGRHPRAANCATEKRGVGHVHVLSASSPKVNVGRGLNFKSHLKLSVCSLLHFLRHLETVQQLLFFPFKPLKLPLALLSSQFLLLHALLVVLECAQLS